MYILKNKLRFISPLHYKEKSNFPLALLILISTLAIYSKLYLLGLLITLILIGAKLTLMYTELSDYIDSVEYSQWLDIKENSFIRRILKYSGYIYYPISVIVISILIYSYFYLLDDNHTHKIITVLITIAYLHSMSIYYTKSIKLRQ